MGFLDTKVEHPHSATFAILRDTRPQPRGAPRGPHQPRQKPTREPSFAKAGSSSLLMTRLGRANQQLLGLWVAFAGTILTLRVRLRASVRRGEVRAVGLYRALTMAAHHHAMKIRDNMSAVIEGLQKDHALLAAFLEATDKIDCKIDWRALHKPVEMEGTVEPARVEAQEASAQAQLPGGVPLKSFVFRRANLVRGA